MKIQIKKKLGGGKGGLRRVWGGGGVDVNGEVKFL